jgi:6-phosphogluconolactonase
MLLLRRNLALFPCLLLLASIGARGADLLVLFGTRLAEPGRGLSVAHFDTVTGALSEPRMVFETPAPVFSVSSPDGRYVYVCHGLDSFAGQAEGFVSAFSVGQPDGALTLLNQQAIGSRGASHVSLDHTGRFLLEASYRSGHVVVFALETDGRIGARTALIEHTGRSVHPQRQAAPHPHAIYVDPSNRFALVPDLGLDKVLVYRFDARNGTLTPNDPPAATLPPGSGPRHLAWHPDGRHVYLIDELVNAVTVFTWNGATGTLAATQTIPTLEAGFTGENTAAEIAVHPSGRFIYASNRGTENCVTVFSVDPASGQLALVERVSSRGKWPRNFTIDPEGRWMVVSNHDSDNAVVFRIAAETGRLTPVGDPVSLPTPFGTRFLPPAR